MQDSLRPNGGACVAPSRVLLRPGGRCEPVTQRCSRAHMGRVAGWATGSEGALAAQVPTRTQPASALGSPRRQHAGPRLPGARCPQPHPAVAELKRRGAQAKPGRDLAALAATGTKHDHRLGRPGAPTFESPAPSPLAGSSRAADVVFAATGRAFETWKRGPESRLVQSRGTSLLSEGHCCSVSIY